jgi:hypothetical protein
VTIKVPAVGEVLVLQNFLNIVAPQNQKLHLYSNNITPSNTDTLVTYTECVFGNYAEKGLTGGGWDAPVSGNPSTIAYTSAQTFTFNGTGAETIYGYYVNQTTSTVLMWAERDPSPLLLAQANDAYIVTPALACDST